MPTNSSVAGLQRLSMTAQEGYVSKVVEEEEAYIANVYNTDVGHRETQVIDIQAALREPDVGRQDLADILKDVQAQEKQNLRMVSLYFHELHKSLLTWKTTRYQYHL